MRMNSGPQKSGLNFPDGTTGKLCEARDSESEDTRSIGKRSVFWFCSTFFHPRSRKNGLREKKEAFREIDEATFFSFAFLSFTRCPGKQARVCHLKNIYHDGVAEPRLFRFCDTSSPRRCGSVSQAGRWPTIGKEIAILTVWIGGLASFPVLLADFRFPVCLHVRNLLCETILEPKPTQTTFFFKRPVFLLPVALKSVVFPLLFGELPNRAKSSFLLRVVSCVSALGPKPDSDSKSAQVTDWLRAHWGWEKTNLTRFFPV